MKVVDGAEQNSLNPIFLLAWFLQNVALCYQREAQCLPYWQEYRVVLDDFHTHFSYLFQVTADCGLEYVEVKC